MHYTQATQRNAYNVRSTLTVLSVDVSLQNKQSVYIEQSEWPSGPRRCVQVAVQFSGRGFESLF